MQSARPVNHTKERIAGDMRAILGEFAQRLRGLKSLTKTEIGKWEEGLLSDSEFSVKII